VGRSVGGDGKFYSFCIQFQLHPLVASDLDKEQNETAKKDSSDTKHSRYDEAARGQIVRETLIRNEKRGRSKNARSDNSKNIDQE
jgi:hypothetical protein